MLFRSIDRILDTTATQPRPVTETSLHSQRSSVPGTGQPSKWALQSAGASTVTILLDTVPQSSYTLQADGTTTLADLTSSDIPAFTESFHDILVFCGIAEELLKKEKIDLAREFSTGDPENPGRAEKLISALVFQMADSPTKVTKQGQFPGMASGTFGTAGAGTLGGTAYTQSALVTFDLGAGVAPFAVAQPTAATVANLDADRLDGEEGTFYLDRANHTGAFVIPVTTITPVTTNTLIGRDTAGTGAAEEIALSADLEFTGAQAIRVAAYTGDLVKAAGATATLLRDGAACSVIGRSVNSIGAEADIPATTNNTVLTRIANALAWVAGLVFDGAGRVQQIAFAAAQSASVDANTLDDYEENLWTPTDASGAGLALVGAEGS